MPLSALGSLPSVVYLIWLTPEPEPSLAESVTVTPPACQTPQPPEHEIVVVGAVVSATTVKGVFALERPAPFVANTFWPPLGALALAENV